MPETAGDVEVSPTADRDDSRASRSSPCSPHARICRTAEVGSAVEVGELDIAGTVVDSDLGAEDVYG